jgi:hypothetical protein
VSVDENDPNASFFEAGMDPRDRPGYAWAITEDLLEPRTEIQEHDHRDEVGVCGPHGITPDAILYVLLNGQYFEIRDDDGIPYMRGYIAALPPKKADDFDGFEPLDDFGRGNSGATDIAYAKRAPKENAKGDWQENPAIEWEML